MFASLLADTYQVSNSFTQNARDSFARDIESSVLAPLIAEMSALDQMESEIAEITNQINNILAEIQTMTPIAA